MEQKNMGGSEVTFLPFLGASTWQQLFSSSFRSTNSTHAPRLQHAGTPIAKKTFLWQTTGRRLVCFYFLARERDT